MGHTLYRFTDLHLHHGAAIVGDESAAAEKRSTDLWSLFLGWLHSGAHGIGRALEDSGHSIDQSLLRSAPTVAKSSIFA